jgi:hypothetical protein
MKRIDDITIIEEGINKAAKEPDEGWMIQGISSDVYRQASYESKKDIIIAHSIDTGKRVLKQFPELLISLRDFEKLLYATNKFYRDHVFHTFRVWGLGLYLYYNGLREFIDGIDERIRSHFHFTWYLASVYHDVGYPIKGLKDLGEQLNKCFNYLGLVDLVNFDRAFKPLPNDNSINPLLNDQSLKDLKGLLPDEIVEIDREVLERRHGLTGALLLLSSLNRRFGTSWSKDAYPAIKAIAEHDGSRRIYFRNGPFSAILVICDELQEWGRPYISPLLEERYVTTDHIELELGSEGATPRIKARINYKEFQNELKKILRWDGSKTENDKKENLRRLNGINVYVDMDY